MQKIKATKEVGKMNKKRKSLIILIIINILLTMIIGLFQNAVLAANQKVSTDIEKIDDEKYPGIKEMIQELQEAHPNWKFKLLYTELDWEDVIEGESSHGKNLIGANQDRYSGKWICPTCRKKGYSGGNWVCVSEQAISYMMDPRNSLYYADVFQFLELSYDEETKYDQNAVKEILTNTFLDDGSLDDYVEAIMKECKNYKVNPYYVAAKIIQEQGINGGSTFKMSENSSSAEINLDEEKKIITVVPNTKVKDIIAFLGENYKIKNNKKKELKSGDTVGTGYTIEDKYTIVMLGDVNGDGKVKATDYMKIKNYIMKKSSLNEYQKIAADVNLDGKIKATDYMKIKNYIMGESNITVNGVVYYYNIFNINATGSTVSDIIENALSKAKEKGWDTIEKCIQGGIEFIANGYISVGQDTMYFEKFNVVKPTYYSHQYAQDVMYAQNQGTKLRGILEGIGATEYAYTFVIPLYENMPTKACARPSTN